MGSGGSTWGWGRSLMLQPFFEWMQELRFSAFFLECGAFEGCPCLVDHGPDVGPDNEQDNKHKYNAQQALAFFRLHIQCYKRVISISRFYHGFPLPWMPINPASYS
mgnify:CR=1 FL=1